MNPLNLSTCPLSGSNLIEAGAGTGKTYTITGLFLRLILEEKLTIDRILVVTFTEAATEELRGRLLRRLQEALQVFSRGQSDDPFLSDLLHRHQQDPSARSRLEEALQSFDQAPVFTIHGFCLRMLNDHAFESGALFDTELVGGQDNIEREIAEDYWRITTSSSSGLFVNYLSNRRIVPENLLAAVGRYLTHPHLTIIPDVDRQDTGELEDRYSRASVAVSGAWQTCRDAVAAILTSHPGLHRGRYRLASMPLLIKQMDRFARSSGEEPDLFPTFEKFTGDSIAAAAKKGHESPDHPFFQLCDDLLAAHEDLQAAFDRQLLVMKLELFDYLRRELASRKARKNIRSFDDLLSQLHTVLSKSNDFLAKAIRKRYPAALIDEFQDTDPLQYEIFTTIFGSGSTLFLIGDPKQAIYGFRGADIFAYLAAVGGVDNQYTLEENWRSEPALIQAVNTVFSRSPAPFVYNEIGFQPSRVPAAKPPAVGMLIDGNRTAPLRLWQVPAGEGSSAKPMPKEVVRRRIIEAVTGEIVRLLDGARQGRVTIGDRPLIAADIAVLVRKNHEAQLMKAALSGAGVPAVVFSSGSVFRTVEAVELERLMRGMIHPEHDHRLNAALTTDLIGVSGNDLAAMDDDNRRDAWVAAFRGYNDTWRRRGFSHVFQQVLREQRILVRMMALPDGERRMTNIRHLGELLHQESLCQADSMEGLADWLARQGASGRRESDDEMLRLESDDHAVKLITVHKSKGLEFPVVFCPFTWDGSRLPAGRDGYTFHDGARETGLTLDLGSDQQEESRRLAERELKAENVRLLYVALTRACNRCYWVWGLIRGADSSAPAHLLHRADDTETNSQPPDLTAARIKDDLQQLAGAYDPGIAVEALPVGADDFLPAGSGNEPGLLACRQFAGSIDRGWRIASFSSFVSRHPFAADMADRDDTGEAESPLPAEVPAGKNVFSFPKGAGPGTCLHQIMETIDFSRLDRPETVAVITEILEKYRYDPTWVPVVVSMVKAVVDTPLDSDDRDFKLAAVQPADRLNEMEFYFPVDRMRPAALSDVFRKAGAGRYPESFFARMNRLDQHALRGVMKGYIDLVFRFGGRYYIIDWKSNHLGNSLDAYRADRLAAVMAVEAYILQYHIYTIALHRYLTARLPGYSYADHFGGVFYVFMRGVDPVARTASGIYYDKPDEALIKGLMQKMTADRGDGDR
jgi:exodeoxyribonuclease V beta subunit